MPSQMPYLVVSPASPFRHHGQRRALASALLRYERMSSPPGHLQYPLVPSLPGARSAELAAARRGDVRGAAALHDWIAREERRLYRLAHWRGRSVRAWAWTVARLALAIRNARDAGFLVGDMLRYCGDRLLDAQAQWDRAIDYAASDDPAVN